MATTREEAKVRGEAGTRPVQEHAGHRAQFQLGEAELRASIDAILNRHPAVGLAVGIVLGSLDFFHGRGFAEVASRTPIDEDTVFRIGSVTKPLTAIAVMQLHE
jgi:CubicO group peptidase (beta-lactamase class C family)